MSTPKNVRTAYARLMKHKDWLYLRARPWKERARRYPFRTVWCALLDRWYGLIASVTRNPLITGHTFWGARMTVRFPEYRTILTDGILDSKELALTEYLVQNLQQNDVFFDVGANAGYFAMLAHALGVQTVAFEAFPATALILKQNAPGITVVAKALMDTNGTVRFSDFGAGAGLNTALSSQAPEEGVLVSTITLDTYVEESGIIPTILKIDAENAEAKVLTGGKHTIEKHLPTLIIETADEDIMRFLATLGYTVQQFDEFGTPRPHVIGAAVVNDNLLFTHR